MRLLFSMIGYLAVATVLSLGIGFGFLWMTERLDDEKMFQIIALMHDVNLNEISQEEEPVDDLQAPPEELSLDQSRVMRQIVLRDHEVKQSALRRWRQEGEFWHNKFRDERVKLDRIAQQIDQLLDDEGNKLQRESINNVVRDLQSIAAEDAKDQLQLTLQEEKGLETVIMLMNAMDEGRLQKILKTFTSDKDKADLHLIHREMLKGGPQKELLDGYVDELDSIDR